MTTVSPADLAALDAQLLRAQEHCRQRADETPVWKEGGEKLQFDWMLAAYRLHSYRNILRYLQRSGKLG